MRKALWMGLALGAAMVLGGCGGSSGGGGSNDNTQSSTVSGQVLVPDDGSTTASNGIDWLNWILSVAHAQDGAGTQGLVARQPDSLTIEIFDPEADGGNGAYVDLGADLSEGLTLGSDGTYELDFEIVGEAVEEAVLDRFPGREINSFLAEDCVIRVEIDGEELRVPLARTELDLSPASEFLSQELEDGGDFTNVTLDEVSELLGEVEGIAASADGAASVQEVVERLREAAGDTVRARVETARQAEGDAAAVAATYDLLWLEFVFEGREHPDDGSAAGFGATEAIVEHFPLTIDGNGSDISVDTDDGRIVEVELQASDEDNGQMDYHTFNADAQDEPRSESFDGKVTADGSFTVFVPAFTQVGANQGSVDAATTLRFRPTGGNGGFVAAPGFTGADYEATDGALDLGRRTGREGSRALVLAFERPEQDVTSLTGHYGGVGVFLELQEFGEVVYDSLVFTRDFGGSPYTGSFEALTIDRETDFSVFAGAVTVNTGGPETGAIENGTPAFDSPNGLTLSETVDGEERTATGYVLEGGESFALMEFDQSDESAQAAFGGVLLEYNVLLADSGADDAAGRSFRLHLMELELDGGDNQADADSEVSGLDGALLTVPSAGLAVGNEVTVSGIRSRDIQRRNDADRIAIANEDSPDFTLSVDEWDPNTGQVELSDGTLVVRGFISADGETLALTTFEPGTNSARAGLLVGTGIPESE